MACRVLAAASLLLAVLACAAEVPAGYPRSYKNLIEAAAKAIHEVRESDESPRALFGRLNA